MIELAKHIEVLLLENDCVIVPGLGGFIAHNRQAEFKESENLFSSPARTIGFNPQLVMNDGLLVQTYMQAYNTDFPDATRKIEKIVSNIKEQLYQKGEVLLPSIGTLYYTMNGTYVFEPSADTFFTPYLYGLDCLKLSPLKALAPAKEVVTVHPFVHTREQKASKEVIPSHIPAAYKRTFQRIAQHTVGIAAAILLFFLLSVPVENTYMDDASYASLSAESMFDALRGRSAATQLLSTSESNQVEQQVKRTKNNVNTLKPVCVKSETVAPAPVEKKVVEKKTTPAPVATTAKTAPKVETKSQPEVKSTKGFYLIVASLPTSADAQKQLKVFKDKGFSNACVVESGDRHRIALYRYNQSADAYKKLKELRAQEDYKSAWVFVSK